MELSHCFLIHLSTLRRFRYHCGSLPLPSPPSCPSFLGIGQRRLAWQAARVEAQVLSKSREAEDCIHLGPQVVDMFVGHPGAGHRAQGNSFQGTQDRTGHASLLT